MKPNILVVDDDRLLLEQSVDMLVELDAEIFLATSGKEALAIIEKKNIDVLILDLILSDMNGEEVLDMAKKKGPDIDVIIISGYATVDSVIKMTRKGIFDYITKPMVPEEFKFTVTKCLRQRVIIGENKKLKEYLLLYELGKMLTGNLDLAKVYDNILIAFNNFLKNGAVVVVGADLSGEYDIKAFSGLDRQVVSECRTSLLAHAKNPEELRAKEKISDGIFLYDTAAFGLHKCIQQPLMITMAIDGIGKKKGDIFAFVHAISEDKKETLGYLREQINLAVENAWRYMNAQELAYIDELTKSYNIRYLYVALENEIRRAERFGSFVSVLFLDLDFFKTVNDTHGHLVGSKLLIEIAGEIKKSIRGIDTVVRYGGDEFVVICTETDTDLAKKVAERIRMRIAERVFFEEDGYNIKITASIGIATYPNHASNKTELIDLSDKAMYHGKEISRNVVCVTEKVAKK